MACVVKGCNEKKSKHSVLTFHGFPKNDSLRQLWLEAIDREDFQLTQQSRVCSKHFSRESCSSGGWSSRQTLNKDAVPSVLLGGTLECESTNLPVEPEVIIKMDFEASDESQTSSKVYNEHMIADHEREESSSLPDENQFTIEFEFAEVQDSILEPVDELQTTNLIGASEESSSALEPEHLENPALKISDFKSILDFSDAKPGLSEAERDYRRAVKMTLLRKNRQIKSLTDENTQLEQQVLQLEAEVKLLIEAKKLAGTLPKIPQHFEDSTPENSDIEYLDAEDSDSEVSAGSPAIT